MPIRMSIRKANRLVFEIVFHFFPKEGDFIEEGFMMAVLER